MDHPDMALRVHRDAADLAEDPVVRQRLWPGGVDGEGGDVAGVRGSWCCNEHCSGEAGGSDFAEMLAGAIKRRRHECLPMFFIGGLSRSEGSQSRACLGVNGLAPSLRGAKRRSNPALQRVAKWIAS